MRNEISAQTAQARHPELFEQLVAKIQASKSKTPIPADPAEWKWAYESAERVEAFSIHQVLAMTQQGPQAPQRELRGREKLASKPDGIYISLDVRAGKRQASAQLDNQALLAGPDSQLPLEALGVHPKPSDPSVWLWRQKRGEDHAWHEHMLKKAIQTPKGLIIDVQRNDFHNDAILLEDGSNTGRTLVSFEGVLKGAELTAYTQADRKGVSSDKAVILNPIEVAERLMGANGRARVFAPESTVSELLAALSGGSGFMAFGPTPVDEPAVAPDEQGPWIDWEGNQVSAPSVEAPRARMK